ncbi:Transglutaminase-like enzyme, putative cysteine protease [Mucilaginibacter mallensis]|uniref:Transglutaminase-like enzyme, putative cysteine protease n=1 Tax=Mucilaginibacter mallensis TaxID=652787 RepID=A0A1H1ZVT4_MUCMA|nr:transglutaminase family protein [Mucilaginibacter mallensis]SDT37502.1 Transglutaminase-like enzyme, putative cysteine protease [Mucilaginibacter mallensis]
MKFDVFTEMEYTVNSPGTLVLNIHALRTPNQTVLNETFVIDPYIKFEELVEPSGNRLVRFEIPEAGNIKVTYNATVDNSFTISDHTHREETPVAHLDSSILPYLYPSRYCQSDKLYRLADNLFGKIADPFEKVIALTNWINTNVQYISGFSNSQTSAYDTVTQQAGVCRDFAHLGIALCRALTIPARYFTGYAYHLKPADFHACFEAYLGGEWVLFDATRLVPLNGLVKIANGRDAADTAIANIFGDIIFTTMQVTCELADENFEPFFYEGSALQGLSYP